MIMNKYESKKKQNKKKHNKKPLGVSKAKPTTRTTTNVSRNKRKAVKSEISERPC